MIKAVIPVAGPGTKLRPHTHTQPKPLIPVAGKPILGHIVDSLIAAGIRDFVFIVGYLGEKIESYVTETYGSRIHIEIVVQTPQEGLGHAIWTAREAVSDCDEVLIALGDTIFDADISRFLTAPSTVLGVQVVDDPRQFGVVETDEETGTVTAVAEKPRIPKSNLAMVGLYKVNEVRRLLNALDALITRPGAQGPFHLTDGLNALLKEGVKISTVTVENWFDCGKKESLLATNRLLLERHNENKTYQFDNTLIIPPVHIGANCKISNSVIGPYVAVAEHATIHNSVVRNSLLGAWSELQGVVLDGSVIGNDSRIVGKSMSMNIGDNTEIDFNE